ncbi:lipopolysaccharide biosynthesis protein [Methylocapsa acidiphila]|uniref:lipopolysaccharide biosynthesis protein n=1 Tax=Methylocapsa acidiphila TaxID=133552 RepID=UPI000425F2C2|nr:hypothetical protein [Methylocapsa acidiphila]
MASSSSLRRVGFTFGAHIFNQVVNIVVQIALVPILLFGWGTERYGVWLLLSAIPVYLTFSDFGFTLSAKNEMTMRVAKGDQHGAVVIYQSVLMLLNMVAVGVVAVIVVALLSIRLGSFLNLGEVSEGQAKLALFLLLMNVILYQYFLLLSGGMRAAGRPATEVAIAALSRLATGLVTAVAAVFGGDLVVAAAIIIVDGVLSIILMIFWLRAIAPWLELGTRHASWLEVKRLFHPSVSFMSQTLGQTLAISGPVMVLGMVVRPLDVVTYSTCRTLARLGTTATNVMGWPLVPEYSRLFGLGNIAVFRRLALMQFAASAGVSAVYFVSLYFLGGWILSLWTKGAVSLVQPFFTLLLVSIVGEMLWSTLLIPLAAINRHVVTANTYGALSFLGVVCSYFLAEPYGLTGVVLPAIVVNTIMMAMVGVQLSRRTPKETKKENE